MSDIPSISWWTASTTPTRRGIPLPISTRCTFNYKYLYEATGRNVGIGWLTESIDDPKHAGSISKAIDAEFENTDTPTKTETEQAFLAGFVAMAGNLALLLNGIGLAVAFTILLVTANTMSIAVRERQQEIAVLKTLGFLQQAGDGPHSRRSRADWRYGRTDRSSVEPGDPEDIA